MTKTIKSTIFNQLNVVTGVREPTVPYWRMRLPATLMSFSVVALLVLLALATVLGVVLYRMSLLGASILRRNDKDLITSNPIMFTTATAACINLVFICIFNYVCISRYNEFRRYVVASIHLNFYIYDI